MIAYFQTELHLVEGGMIEVHFPPLKSEKKPLFDAERRKSEIYELDAPDIKDSKQVRNSLLDICSSSRFHRLTSCAHHIHVFTMQTFNKETWHIVKTQKKGGKPLTIMFESPETAQEFFKVVKKNMSC